MRDRLAAKTLEVTADETDWQLKLLRLQQMRDRLAAKSTERETLQWMSTNQHECLAVETQN